MAIGEPKSLSRCRQFFLEPTCARQRQYEALRAYFLEDRPSAEVARAFGYSPGSFQVLCHHFRREADPSFFVSTPRGPRHQPKKSAARGRIIELRKRNYSVYDISESLREEGQPLSPTAVREVLRSEGFAPLPRRLDEERPKRVGPTIEPVADVRHFSLAPRSLHTRCGGLFLFLPDLVALDVERWARRSKLPGSRMIPAAHALRGALALKLWSIERKSHIMALVSDPGLALFSGLNVIPKKSYLAEYSSRSDPASTAALLATWNDAVSERRLFPGQSFNLDFHSVPYHGENPTVERHYVSQRSRRQPSILTFLAQDADGHAFCYSNADLRKGEESEEIFRFIEFWKRTHGQLPRHLVFDSRLTTLPKLVRLDQMGIVFITLRRRSRGLLRDIALVPRSAWRRIHLDVPARKFQNPRVFEQPVALHGACFRQLFIDDLGHPEPTVILTNDRPASTVHLVTRYAQRMLIENALADAVRFFHIDALSSEVGMKVDFDMALLVVASGLYRLLARRMRGYQDAQARRIFRDLIDSPATVHIAEHDITVQFHRRAHLPILRASGLLDHPVPVPWWRGYPLTLTAQE